MTRGITFDDLHVGEEQRTLGRTVTESDINQFAGLSGDFNSLHVDDSYASKSRFGRRIAHGLLVVSISSGLTTRTPVMDALQPFLLGMLESNVRFRAPVFVGDTLTVSLEIVEKRLTSDGEKAVVTQVCRTLNQRDELVLESEWKLLVAVGASEESTQSHIEQ